MSACFVPSTRSISEADARLLVVALLRAEGARQAKDRCVRRGLRLFQIGVSWAARIARYSLATGREPVRMLAPKLRLVADI